jgi:CHAT domain-containing protein
MTAALGLCSGGFLFGAEAASSADDLMQRAAASARQGSFEEALQAWKEAARQFEQAGETKGQIQALSHAASTAHLLGHLRQAFQHQEQALDLARSLGEPAWVAVTMAELGKLQAANRQYDAALDYVTQASEIATAKHLEALSASLLNDVGIVRAVQGQLPEALAAFQESAGRAGERKDSDLFVRASINGARVATRLERYELAATSLKEADEFLSRWPATHEKADALINLSLGYRNLARAKPTRDGERLIRSAALLQQAASLAQDLGDARLVSYAYGHLGHLYESEYRHDEALQLTRRAVFAAQSARAPESLYRWQWQSGRLLARLGKIDEALAAYQEAASTLQPIRSEVTFASDIVAEPDQRMLRSLFFETADLFLQRAALVPDEPQGEPYLKSARDAIEAYKAAELRDYFRDDCVDQAQSRLTKLERVSDTTAVIYPIIFSDRTELLVNLPTGLKRFSVPITAVMLTSEIRDFRRMLEKRTTREYLPHAQRLYDWLLRPLSQELSKFPIDTLVFVPDGPLRTVPMAALHDGNGFLIERYAVASTPGIDLTDPRPIDRGRVQLLSSGLTRAVQGFPPLPYVAEEIGYIHSLFKGQQLLDTQFVAPRVESELKDGRYGLLHIATHGQFAPDVNKSFLLTFDDKLTMSELERLVGLFRYREDPLELLTLSACQTGIGDDQAALGLAGIAVKAGARSALATLWYINDEASAELVTEFYRQLKDKQVSKARALQLAQLKLLADRVYEHPAFWSAFLLLNNWL